MRRGVVLVAAWPGHFKTGLDALLQAITGIDEVVHTGSAIDTLQQVRSRRPQLAIIEAAVLGRDPETILVCIACLSPATRRILFVDAPGNKEPLAPYTEAIIIQGATPAAIAAIVTDLLSLNGGRHEQRS